MMEITFGSVVGSQSTCQSIACGLTIIVRGFKSLGGRLGHLLDLVIRIVWWLRWKAYDSCLKSLNRTLSGVHGRWPISSFIFSSLASYCSLPHWAVIFQLVLRCLFLLFGKRGWGKRSHKLNIPEWHSRQLHWVVRRWIGVVLCGPFRSSLQGFLINIVPKSVAYWRELNFKCFKCDTLPPRSVIKATPLLKHKSLESFISLLNSVTSAGWWSLIVTGTAE